MSDPSQSVFIENMCLQRSRQQLLNVPPTRFTPVSPYPQFTQFQLDMRRKAEILQYKNNNTNSKTNNLTKAQKFSQLVSNLPELSSGTIARIESLQAECPTNLFTPTPSTSCDVPGPPITLFYDPAIILYNYQSSIIRTYGVENKENTTVPWNLISKTDISMVSVTTPSTASYYPFFSIYFTNACNQGQSMYAFTAPMQLKMSGVATVPNETQQFNVNFVLTSLFIDVYYNNTLMSTSDPSKVNTSLSKFAISQVLQKPVVTVTVTKLQNFSIVFYLGLLRATNIIISTYPGFIYDVRLRPSFGINASIDNANLSGVGAEIFANCSTGITTAVGCTLVTTPSTDPFTPLELTLSV